MVQQVPPLPQTTPEKKPAPQPAAPAEGELERVREIILGPDLARQRIQGAEVDRLRQVIFGEQIEEDVDRLGSRETALQQLVTRAQQQDLHSQSTQEMLQEIRTTQQQHENEVRTLKSTLGENRDQQERRLDTLKREVCQAEDDLCAELRRVTDRLGDQKADRKALAVMLMEVATRLETGSTVTGLLEGLTSAAKE